MGDSNDNDNNVRIIVMVIGREREGGECMNR